MLPKHKGPVHRCFSRLLLLLALMTGCSSNPLETPPPTIEPAQPADSPPVTQNPAGAVRPLGGHPQAAAFDTGTRSLAVLCPGADPTAPASITVFGDAQVPPRVIALPGPATALTSDDRGTAYLAARGGYFVVDLAAGRAVAGRTSPTRKTSISPRSLAGPTASWCWAAPTAPSTPLLPDTCGGRQRHRRQPKQDLRTRRFTCNTREYDRRSGSRADIGDDDRRRRSCRAGAAGRRRRDHHGRRSAGPGAGRRHPRRRNCWCSASTR